MRWLKLVLFLFLIPLLSWGVARDVSAQSPVSKVAAAASLKKGTKVFVRWQGSFWKARVLVPVDARRVVIHYDGWGAEHDEIVGLARIAFEVAPPTRSARKNDPLYVEWKGSYWPARVTEIHGQRVKIRYDGYGAKWDEVVGPARIKHLRPHPAHQQSIAKLKAGDKVKVLWGKRYWAATILSVVGKNRFSIHYDGYGPEWDEVVGPSRIRTP